MRSLLTGGLPIALLLGGCGASAESAASHEPSTCEQKAGTPSSVVVPGDEHLAQRLRCEFSAGQTTRETVGSTLSKPPIEHVVVLMMENRSFDHFYSDLSAVGVDADVAGDVSNPTGDGGSVARYHETQYCFGAFDSPSHEWSDAHVAHAAGRMDGFVAGSGTCAAMAYYTHDDLPFWYELAKTFAISARHFASLLGPTWPNREFFLAGTSCGFAEGTDTNPDFTLSCGSKQRSILNALRDAGISTRVYDESGFFAEIVGSGVYVDSPASIDDFVSDAAGNALPKVSIVGASTGVGASLGLNAPEDDDHPPSNVQLGEQFAYRIVSAMLSNPQTWASSVLFITYDENGGFYDHVEPPPACDPEPAKDTEATRRDYLFTQYGFRVPLIAVSPFARAGYVSMFDSDHTSITRFIEHVFGLGALTARDANAWPLLDLFDFSGASPPMTPALTAPPPAGTCPADTRPTCQK